GISEKVPQRSSRPFAASRQTTEAATLSVSMGVTSWMGSRFNPSWGADASAGAECPGHPLTAPHGDLPGRPSGLERPAGSVRRMDESGPEPKSDDGYLRVGTTAGVERRRADAAS